LHSFPTRRSSDLSLNDQRKAVPLRTVQASLGRDEMLLEYVLGEAQSYCLRITRTVASIVVLPNGRKRIEELVDNYLGAVRSRQPESKSAGELFSMLLDPVVGQQPQTKLIV